MFKGNGRAAIPSVDIKGDDDDDVVLIYRSERWRCGDVEWFGYREALFSFYENIINIWYIAICKVHLDDTTLLSFYKTLKR